MESRLSAAIMPRSGFRPHCRVQSCLQLFGFPAVCHLTILTNQLNLFAKRVRSSLPLLPFELRRSLRLACTFWTCPLPFAATPWLKVAQFMIPSLRQDLAEPRPRASLVGRFHSPFILRGGRARSQVGIEVIDSCFLLPFLLTCPAEAWQKNHLLVKKTGPGTCWSSDRGNSSSSFHGCVFRLPPEVGAHSSGSVGTMRLRWEASVPQPLACLRAASPTTRSGLPRNRRRHESTRTEFLSFSKACQNPHGKQCPILPTRSGLNFGESIVRQLRWCQCRSSACKDVLGCPVPRTAEWRCLDESLCWRRFSSHYDKEKTNRR